MMVSLFFCVSVAFANAEIDLKLAADAKANEKQRMEAFDRLVSLGGTNLRLVLDTAGNPAADLRLRWVSIRVLGQVGGAPVLNLLPTLIQDEDPSIRAAVCRAFGDLRSKSHVKLVGARLKDRAIIVRAAAAAALGQIGASDSVDQLGEALEDESNWLSDQSLWVRQQPQRRTVPTVEANLTDVPYRW